MVDGIAHWKCKRRSAPLPSTLFTNGIFYCYGNDFVLNVKVTLGAIRAYDGGHMLEVCPPFLHGEANPQDQYSFVLPGGSEYEYSTFFLVFQIWRAYSYIYIYIYIYSLLKGIQNVSEQPDPKMLDKLDQQHVALDAKAGRLRQNLVGHGYILIYKKYSLRVEIIVFALKM